MCCEFLIISTEDNKMISWNNIFCDQFPVDLFDYIVDRFLISELQNNKGSWFCMIIHAKPLLKNNEDSTKDKKL